MALIALLTAPAVAFGVLQSKSALKRQNISSDLQTVLVIWERLDQHWSRFLAAEDEKGKAFEFGQLSGYYELACGLFRDRVLTTQAARTLREHLTEILPRMQANPDFAAQFESLRGEPSTFENIEWFCSNSGNV